MSRSQSTQIANTGQANSAQNQGNAQNAFGAAMPALQAQLANPGYSQAQQTAITGATEGGLGAAFGNAQETASNTAARTNNASGLTATNDALARQRGITSGNLAAQNQSNFANNAQQQKQQALQGISGLYGTSLGGANSALNTAESASAASPSFMDQLGSGLAGTLGRIRGGVTNSPTGQTSSFGFG